METEIGLRSVSRVRRAYFMALLTELARPEILGESFGPMPNTHSRHPPLCADFVRRSVAPAAP